MAVAALAPLPEPENLALLKTAKSGDPAAKDLFFAHNYRLLCFIARKFENTGMMLDDLIGLAQVGFVKAYNTFDLTKEIKFATYSTRCMENEILMALRKAVKYRGHLSLDEPLSVDPVGNVLTITDVLQAGDPEEEEKNEQLQAVQEVLHVFMKTAKPREAEILRLFYWEGKTQRQIAETLGISQSYISRLQGRIENNLRKIAHRQGTIDNVKGEVVKMASINKGHLKYLFENTGLNNGQIATVVGCTGVMVGKYRRKYDNGRMQGIKPDDTIKPRLNSFMASLTPDARRKAEERFKRRATPIVTTKLEDESSDVRVYFVEPRPASPAPNQPATEAPPSEAPSKKLSIMEAALAEVDAGREQVAVTSEDELLTRRAEAPPSARKSAVTLTLDRVDAATIEAFLHTIRTQMREGETYRLHVQLESQ